MSLSGKQGLGRTAPDDNSLFTDMWMEGYLVTRQEPSRNRALQNLRGTKSKPNLSMQAGVRN